MIHLLPFLRAALFISFILISRTAIANGNDKNSDLMNLRNHKVDSLQRLLNTESLSEKQQLDIYYFMANNYSGLEVDSSLLYATKGIPLAKKFNEYKILMVFYTHVAAAHCFRGDFDSALMYCDRLLESAMEQKDKEWEAIAYIFYAEVYRKQGKYITAIDYYLNSLKISEAEGLFDSYMGSLIYLSEINRRLGNTETALFYTKQAETEYNKMPRLTQFEWRLTAVLNEYAFIYLKLDDVDQALHYALRSDSINGNRFVENTCHVKGLLATIYLRQNEHDLALQYARESYEWAGALIDKNLYAFAGKILSDVYLALKRYPEAEAAALKVWMADSTSIDESRAVVENIALANIHMQHSERAAYYLKKYAELNALYAEKSFHTTMSDLEVKYETDKKETRIATLEKERRLNVWLVIFSILLACLLGIALFQFVRNARKQRLLIAAESIQEGELNERMRIAEQLHDRLGGSLSAVKIGLKNEGYPQSASNKIDDCMNEIRDITNNIMPRTLRLFGMKAALEDLCVGFRNVRFHFFGEDKRVKYNLEFAVYCCAKELVNNALKHSNAAHINVQLVQGKSHISLTVQDDGCGFDEKTALRGDGLQNIRNRVASFNGRMDISTSPGKGTDTVIELKI